MAETSTPAQHSSSESSKDGEFEYETSPDSFDEDELQTEFIPIRTISPPKPVLTPEQRRQMEDETFIAG